MGSHSLPLLPLLCVLWISPSTLRVAESITQHGITWSFDPDDREYARRHVQAVHELERLLFVRESSGRDKYELTNFGWLIGRKLKQEQKLAGETQTAADT